MNSEEAKGRFFLWHAAICETQRLISLAIKCENASKSPQLRDVLAQRMERYHAFRKQQPDYQEGIQFHSHLVEFGRLNPEPFPSITDCFQLKDSNTMLAVVMYCQIYMSGYLDEGTAASNNKPFREEHLEPILVEVFPSTEDREIYEAFVEKIVSARNKMLGHADAEAFEVKHGTPVSSHKLHVTAIKDIDLHYWQSFLEPLRVALLKYSNGM
ncbi:hypothetical protein ACU5EH_22460 [Aliivibrio salmonicida]|uniref:hypothetical protein n=1 Tax=Aliivibrio salmonicida TaxID=40269 RepID=UPI00406C939F